MSSSNRPSHERYQNLLESYWKCAMDVNPADGTRNKIHEQLLRAERQLHHYLTLGGEHEPLDKTLNQIQQLIGEKECLQNPFDL